MALKGSDKNAADRPASSEDGENGRCDLKGTAGEQLPHNKAEINLGAAHICDEQYA